MIKPIVLWSDVLIYLLVLAVGMFFALLKGDVQSRERWHRVFQSPVATFSFLIILFYIFIALLDSLHYRRALPVTTTLENQEVHYSNEVESTLDWLLMDLKSATEITYSAPFSIYSFAKENQQAEDGSTYRDFPRLKNGGAHLFDPSKKSEDIFRLVLRSMAFGLIPAVFLILLLWHIQQRYLPASSLPWRTLYLTVLGLSLMVSFILLLGARYHVLGTDKAGTDVMYLGIKAVRTGVLIGSLATLLTLPFAIGLGISAGYFKGWVDDLIQFIYTTLSSIPDILLIAAAVLVLDVYIQARAEDFPLLIQRSDFKFLTLCFILGITSWTGLCRLLRAETLKVSQLDYVQAATAFGVSHRGIILRHILPNVMHLVLISVVLNFSSFVLAEAVLSYIGVGVDASMVSWGNMINGARQELSRDPTVWWTITSAFLWMFLLVLAANLFADRVREAFDPRVYHETQRQRRPGAES